MTYKIIPVIAYACRLVLLFDLVISGVEGSLQQPSRMLQPLGKHVPGIQTITTEALYNAVAIVEVSIEDATIG